MGYLGTIYSIHTLFAVKRYLDLKMFNFSVQKIGFGDDTFVARQHNTNGIFQFSLKFLIQLMCSSKQTELVVNAIKRKLIAQKPA